MKKFMLMLVASTLVILIANSGITASVAAVRLHRKRGRSKHIVSWYRSNRCGGIGAITKVVSIPPRGVRLHSFSAHSSRQWTG